MKKILTLWIMLFALLGLSNLSTAQITMIEKTYEVSGKAKRGFLDKIESNPEKGTFDMVYILNSASTTKQQAFMNIPVVGLSGKLKYEIITYDKDLNLLGTAREEERVYVNRYKDYSYTSVEYAFGLSGPSFSKVQVSANYNWYYGYRKQTKVIEKIRLKEEYEGKYAYTANGAYDVAKEGAVLAVVGIKTKKAYTQFNKMDILRCDKDMNITVTDSVRFEYPYFISYSAPVTDKQEALNDEMPRDWIIIFTPFKGTKSLPSNPKPNELTFMRLSPQGKIKEQFTFESPANAWLVEGAYEEGGAVYLYGAGMSKDPTTTYSIDLTVNKPISDIELTHYQIAKLKNKKVEYISCTPFSEIQAKQSKPANQKKTLEIDGMQYTTSEFKLMPSGEMMVTFQDYERVTSPSVHTVFGNCFLFYFDASGKIKRSFGVALNPDAKKIGAEKIDSRGVTPKHFMYPSADGKSTYWIISTMKNVACMGTASADHNNIDCKPLSGIDYGKFSLETGEMSEFKTIGADSKDTFYQFGGIVGYQIGNYVYTFGETEKGNKMHLSRIDISK